MEQVNDHRFDVEAQHAAEAIAIYMAVTGKGEAAYSREKSRTKWERAAIAASNMRRKHPHSAVQTLSEIGAVAACFGRDWPDVPGDPEILRRVKWAARQMKATQERKPLSQMQVKEILCEAHYSTPGPSADFINGLRHGEMAHGITHPTGD